MRTMFFLFCFFSVTFLSAQKINLQLNLHPGETYSQLQTSKLTIDETINGKETEIELTVSAKTNYHVLRVKDSVFETEMNFIRLSLQMKSSQGEVEMSSDNDSTGDVMGRALKALTNQPVFARITRRGRFLEVRSDSLIEKVVNEFSEIDDAKKAQMKQQLKQSWGEEAFKSSFEMLSAIYPAENVELGNKWSVHTQLKSTILLNVDAVYTFIKSSEDRNTIHGDIKLSPLNKGAVSSVNGMPVIYDLNGTMTSDIKLDKQTGWISNATITQSLSGTANIQDNAQVPGGMAIPMSMKAVTILDEQ